jgi:hypothetical protein
MVNKYQTYIILGIYFSLGLFLGFTIARKPTPHPNKVTVDIIKEGNEILIYQRNSGNLVFEYNKHNPADKTAYREFNNLWTEAKSNLDKN